MDLAHSMGLRVVAEGIEDAATLRILTDIGCDVAQGYFIAPPRPAELLNLQAPTPGPDPDPPAVPEPPVQQMSRV